MGVFAIMLDSVTALVVSRGLMDNETAKLLGIEPVPAPRVPAKPVNRLDLSAILKDRYHHRMTYQQIADKYGVSKPAVYDRLQKFEAQLGQPEELRAFQDVEADIQAAIKQRFSSHLLNSDLTKCSPKDAAIVYGTIFDKHRLQTGQSTSNQSVLFSVVGEATAADAPQDVGGKVIDLDPIE